MGSPVQTHMSDRPWLLCCVVKTPSQDYRQPSEEVVRAFSTTTGMLKSATLLAGAMWGTYEAFALKVKSA